MSKKISTVVNEVKLIYKNKTKASQRPLISNSQDAYEIFEANWSDQISLVEEFNILLLDRSNRVMSMCQISKGGVSGTVVDLKIVFVAAIQGRASSIILAHNHPSGDPKPSREDIAVTDRLTDVGKTVGIDVLDHIVMGRDGLISVREFN